MVDFENSSAMAVSATSVEGTECSSGGNETVPPPEIQPMKKKRNLPGMPDPDAEVIALSPTTLLATNRFVCEICNKGFQRDQNLQLHRRGHNLPWKLKQRDGKEIRKRVYVCPEKTCIHHDPSRALGDLTGIKKHFSRKHGEKKWKCERCSKKYAVQSDWKAHMKTCGSKEYRCDCGTLFSRRDSFITHRAFCDALAQESARSQTRSLPISNSNHHSHGQEIEKVEAAAAVLSPSCSPPPPPLTPSTGVLSPVQSVHSSELPEKATENTLEPQKGALMKVETAETCFPTTTTATATIAARTTTGGSTSSGNNNVSNRSTGVFASIFATSSSHSSPASYSNMICGVAGADRNTTMEPMSLSLSSSLYHSTAAAASLFPPPDQHHRQYVQTQQPALSATALLQKAAQMGATSSNTSFLHALGLAPPPPPPPPRSSSSTDHYQEPSISQWSNIQSKQERNDNPGLRLGIPTSDHLLMGPPAPTTLDFLGLGMDGGTGGGSSGGYSAFLSSIRGSNLNVSAAGVSFRGVQNDDWDDSDDKKPPLL